MNCQAGENMDTILTLLSLVESRLQARDRCTWQEQAPLFFQLLRSLNVKEIQLLSQRILAQYLLGQDQTQEDTVQHLLDLLAQMNMFVPGALD
jgi:hypothetical protein